MSKHARLSPSNHRWSKCPGSVREEAAYPDIAGEAAIDGTGSHLLLELCLMKQVTPSHYLGSLIGANHEDKPNGWVVHQDRIDRVTMVTDYIERRKKELSEGFSGCSISVEAESKSYPGDHFGRDDWYGTCDVTMTVHDDGIVRFVEVIDLKDGRSWVDVKGNSQLLSYLAGKLGDLTKDRLIHTRMTIVQPRTRTPVRYEDSDKSTVYDAALLLFQAAKRTDYPDAPLVPDNKKGKGHCSWCKHKKNCVALREVKEKGVNMLVDIKGDLKDKSSDELSSLLDQKPILMAKFAEIEEEIESRLDRGESVKGYLMQPGNSKQEWNLSEDELVKKLKGVKLKKDEIYVGKLLSPAQVLKHPKLTAQQKKRFEESYIDKVPGANKLKVAIEKETTVDDLFSSIPINNVVQCNAVDVSFL